MGNYLLTPRSRVFPEKLKRPELPKKFPAFYGTRRFITAFTRAHRLSLSWARHIFISLTNFRGMPNSVRILYNTSLLTESYAFLKSTNSWCTAPLYSHFFSSIWRMQNTWSVVDLLRRNLHWRSPIISSAYRVNLERRMFDRILYAVYKSDMPR
jgi:hypothetical protein